LLSNGWLGPTPDHKFFPVENCLEMDLEGAHVQKDDSKDKNWYIYPLCGKHNATKEKPL
jgi:hypothetical protein